MLGKVLTKVRNSSPFNINIDPFETHFTALREGTLWIKEGKSPTNEPFFNTKFLGTLF
jgi:hypothetical protein